MSSSIELRLESKLRVVETFDTYASPLDATATFDQLSETENLDSGTSVPVTKHAEFEQALSSGTATIDLTALPGKTVDETVDGTGLKVQAIKFRNKNTNANKITISKGASNGYCLDANSTTWSVVLSPGQSVLFKLEDLAPDIAGGAKTIDLAGTLSQVLEVMVVMG